MGYHLALTGKGFHKRLWSVGINPHEGNYIIHEFVDDRNGRFRGLKEDKDIAMEFGYKLVRSVAESYKKQLGLELEDRTSYEGIDMDLPVRKR